MQNQLAPIIKQFEDAKGIKKQVDDYWTRLGVEPYDNSIVMEYVPSAFMRLPEIEPAVEDLTEETAYINGLPEETPEIIENESTEQQQEAAQNEECNSVIVEERIESADRIKTNDQSAELPGNTDEVQVPNKGKPKEGGLLSNLFRKK